MHNEADIGFVDTHAESDSCTNDVVDSLLPFELHLCTVVLVHSISKGRQLVVANKQKLD